ncbi:MAG: methylated-DNA--[protein]-cysteine S-methyltransferase [Planctomycetales bacterium]|nr:methylated-DNA--[protein]-cysteine S-methyltransferase [Planctomycetales bacterium]
MGLLLDISPRRAAPSAAWTWAAARSARGWVAVCGKGEALAAATIGHASEVDAVRWLHGSLPDADWTDDKPSAFAKQLAQRLAGVLAGEADDLADVPLAVDHLRPFARRVTQRCREIPRGQTMTYAELAAACGSPRAARAVGNVMRTNRFPLVVPCHRVVGSGGGLGGYSAPTGLTLKRALLELEGADF